MNKHIEKSHPYLKGYEIIKISKKDYFLYLALKEKSGFWLFLTNRKLHDVEGKSLSRRDIRRISQLEKLRLFVELSKRLSEMDQKWEYMDANELDKLDNKEKDAYASKFGEKMRLKILISSIDTDLGISDYQIHQRREMAKGKEMTIKNIREREELEARERERIRNLPPIDREKLARMQETWDAYIEYKERAKRLKKEANY